QQLPLAANPLAAAAVDDHSAAAAVTSSTESAAVPMQHQQQLSSPLLPLPTTGGMGSMMANGRSVEVSRTSHRFLNEPDVNASSNVRPSSVEHPSAQQSAQYNSAGVSSQSVLSNKPDIRPLMETECARPADLGAAYHRPGGPTM